MKSKTAMIGLMALAGGMIAQATPPTWENETVHRSAVKPSPGKRSGAAAAKRDARKRRNKAKS